MISGQGYYSVPIDPPKKSTSIIIDDLDANTLLIIDLQAFLYDDPAFLDIAQKFIGDAGHLVHVVGI